MFNLYDGETGHAHGWMSSEYLSAVANADRCIGQVVDAMSEGDVAIVTADHGGHLKTHGTDSDEDMTIPFVLTTNGRPNAGGEIERVVRITDVAPTVTGLMGVEAPEEWAGKGVAQSA